MERVGEVGGGGAHKGVVGLVEGHEVLAWRVDLGAELEGGLVGEFGADGCEAHGEGDEEDGQQDVGGEDAQVASVVVEAFGEEGEELLRVQVAALQLAVAEGFAGSGRGFGQRVEGGVGGVLRITVVWVICEAVKI